MTDRLGAALLIVLLAPVFVAVALAERTDSPGPAVHRQTRIGRDGKPFTMAKFRTMVVDAERLRHQLTGTNEQDGRMFKIRRDPRITRVGRVLRRSSLGELPELFNVVRGHMSLVGPRPPLPDEAAGYDEVERRRLAVKPGLTGLWQVSGRSDLSGPRRSPWTSGTWTTGRRRGLRGAVPDGGRRSSGQRRLLSNCPPRPTRPTAPTTAADVHRIHQHRRSPWRAHAARNPHRPLTRGPLRT